MPRPFCTFPSKIVFCGEIAALHSSGYWEYPTSARVVGEKNPKGTSRSTFKRHERVGLTLIRSRGKTMIPAPGHLRYRLLSNGRRRYGAWFSGAEAPGNTRRREFERRGNASPKSATAVSRYPWTVAWLAWLPSRYIKYFYLFLHSTSNTGSPDQTRPKKLPWPGSYLSQHSFFNKPTWCVWAPLGRREKKPLSRPERNHHDTAYKSAI